MRAIWTGGISFGLIYIPASLYSATQTVQLDLDMLQKKEMHQFDMLELIQRLEKKLPGKTLLKDTNIQKEIM